MRHVLVMTARGREEGTRNKSQCEYAHGATEGIPLSRLAATQAVPTLPVGSPSQAPSARHFSWPCSLPAAVAAALTPWVSQLSESCLLRRAATPLSPFLSASELGSGPEEVWGTRCEPGTTGVQQGMKRHHRFTCQRFDRPHESVSGIVSALTSVAVVGGGSESGGGRGRPRVSQEVTVECRRER